jgi:polysaccharide chain length determinant protein (PEP-CTERM system associated)
VAVFVCLFAVSLGLVVGLPSLYRATATVLVDRQQMQEAFVRSAVTGEVETRLGTITQEIVSRSRLDELIQRFDLYPELRQRAPAEAAIEQMRKDIKVEPKDVEQPGGRHATIAFKLSYQGRDPETVAAVTNALAELYVAENSSLRERQASDTADFLKVRVEEMKVKLEEQERRVGTAPKSLEAELAAVERLNMRLRLNGDHQLRLMDRRERLLREARAEGPAAAMAPTDDPVARLAKLRQELVELRTRYSEKYPDVVRIKAEIAVLEQRQPAGGAAAPASPEPRTPTPNAVAQLDQELRTLRMEEQGLRNAISAAERHVEIAPSRLQDFQQRARDHATTKELYASLLKKWEDARTAKSLEQGYKGEGFRILDRAVAPREPIAPNALRLTLMGLALAVGVSVGAVVMADRLDTSFHSVDDLRAFTRVPVVGTIPRVVTERTTAQRRRRFWLATALVGLGLLVVVAGAYLLAHGNESLLRTLSAIK